MRPKNSGTKQLFENPILEKLSRTHIAVPVTMFFVSGAVLGWYAFTYTDLSNGLIGLLFGIGAITFTFIEYWVIEVFIILTQQLRLVPNSNM
jgi:hypothetical protein